jgi:hypothetical protein
MKATKILSAMVFVGILAASVSAKTPDPCSEGCALALRALITEGPQIVIAGSSCDGDYGQTGPATIAMVLSRELSSFGRGKNVLEGGCSKNETMTCALKIHHSYSEDVSSLDIHFEIRAGRVVPGSLQCLLTP